MRCHKPSRTQRWVLTFYTTDVFEPFSISEVAFSFQQGAGPTGKNEEKAQVLTEKIEDLVVQVSIV